MATPRGAAPKRIGTRTRPQSTQTIGPAGSPLSGVDTKYHTPIFIGMILLSLLIFFGGVIFGGKLFVSNDFLSWESFRPYLAMMDEKGESPLWIPYIFSGLPGFAAYLVTGDRWWDLSMKLFYSGEHVFGVINYPVMRVVMHYFIYGVGMFLLMRSKKAARSTSFFVSLAAIFSTWIIIYIMIGHNTKIMALMTFPFIFMCIERLIDRWSLLYAGLLVLAVHILWESSHLQTAFYGACAVGIYMLFELISSLATKEKLMGVLRAAGMLVVAAGLTYGMGLDRNLAVQEYLPYSTRGAAAIQVDPSKPAAEEEGGTHGYEYATGWSFSPEEMFTYLVPGYFGFGKVEYSAPNAPPQEAMIYWGQMAFTDAAHYVGIAVLVLGIFGAWMNRKNRFIQGMIVIGFFGLLLSFGGNFPILFDIFFNLVPGFNKLRAPSQSLVLLEFVFPILAGFGIESLIALHKSGSNAKSEKTILYSAAGFGVFTLIGLLGSSLLKSGYIAAVAGAQGKPVSQHPQLQEYVYNMMIGDWIVAGLVGVATLLLMYYYLKSRISPTVLKLGLLGLLVFDLWRIDYRPMIDKPQEIVAQQHAATDVDAFLQTDTSLYRIVDFTDTPPNYPAYHFHQHIHGYHAAKLRNYQNLLDVAGNGDQLTSPLAWNILNTKYIITPGPLAEGLSPVFTSSQRQAQVYLNTDAMPRAWFVNRVETADALTTLTKIKEGSFDPRDVAYVIEPLKEPVEPVGYSAGAAQLPRDTTAGDTTAPTPAGAATPGRGSVTVTRFEPLHIEMAVDAPGKNFLVISEVHYPPSWRATIDGQPAEIIQTNYVLRGLVIPPGKHKVEMHYVSEGFETGKWASLGLNLVMFAAIAVGAIIERRRRVPEEKDPTHDAPVIDEEDV